MKTVFPVLFALASALPGSVAAASLDAFARTSNAAIAGHNTEHLNAVTPEACATACLGDARKAWCRSFDFNKNAAECDLSDKQASDVGGLKTDYPGNPYDHYALKTVIGTPNPIPGKRHVLVIGIDGLRGDALRCTGCQQTVALSALMNDGAYHTNVRAGGSQATYSGPGWASVFTGFWADRHGVTSNNESLPLRETHVFDRIKSAYPSATVAIVADWYNLTHNLAPVGADEIVVNAAKNSQQATNAVKGWLSRRHAPAAIFYYLHNVDIHSCCYDPQNSAYKAKIRAEDAQIQQVLDALVARPTYANEEWLILVTSDHGGTGNGHGGQSAAERNTLLILDNTYRKPGKPKYCQGDLTSTPLTQIDGATPHILDFLGLSNPTAGRPHPRCGR